MADTPRRPTPSRRPSADPAAQAKQAATRAYQAGDYRASADLARRAVAANPSDAGMHLCLGASLSRIGKADQGLTHLLHADRLQPGHARVLAQLSHCYRALHRLDEAEKAADRAIEIDPDFGPGIYAKATLLRSCGRDEDAWKVVEPAIKRGVQDSAVALAYADLCRSSGRPELGVSVLRDALTWKKLGPAQQASLRFRLGHLLDALGRYDEAFVAYRLANANGPEAKVTDVDALTRLWTPELMDRLPVATKPAEKCVLIVGMPRSGTSLTEQIIAAHPQAAGLGESPVLPRIAREFAVAMSKGTPAPAQMDRLAAPYLAAVESVSEPGTLRVADKLPGNYLHLGIASRLLPGVRVVYCRRDPRDVCLSCYFQDFQAKHVYTRDLETVAQQYVQHHRIMEHWRRVTDLPILDLDYRSLVTDFEPAVRALLDFVGLPFDEACLKFHESKRFVRTASTSQVRQPINTRGLDRWKHYAAQIAPMNKVLADAGLLPNA
jgi:tetratricopeptide (TPR) repeat protein